LAPTQVRGRLSLLDQRLGHPEVVVVGGGYAGVELAAVVAERLRGRARIKLVTSGGDILEGSPEVGAAPPHAPPPPLQGMPAWHAPPPPSH
jgi:NADPH-dependent 2,4-dienoyl-CoA reductase/sulfur reductase-like enzyme